MNNKLAEIHHHWLFLSDNIVANDNRVLPEALYITIYNSFQQYSIIKRLFKRGHLTLAESVLGYAMEKKINNGYTLSMNITTT